VVGHDVAVQSYPWPTSNNVAARPQAKLPRRAVAATGLSGRYGLGSASRRHQ
jgi:hypothetical protein